MEKLITKKQFKRFLVSQPFFIWNSLINNQTFDEADEDTLSQLIWNEDQIEEEYLPISYSQRIAKTFKYINQFLINDFLKKYSCEIIGGSTEEKIKKTLSLLNSGKLLINPVFKYQNAISTPFAFDTKNKCIINIKYSLKTSRKDLISSYWDYEIISQSVNVNDILIFLPRDKDYQKGEIDLYFTNKINISKTGDLPNATKENGEEKDVSIISICQNRFIPISSKNNLLLPNIDDSIKQINQALNVKELSDNLIYDLSEWGENFEWNNLLEKINHPYSGYSGKVLKKALLKDYSINHLTKISSPLLDFYQKLNKNQRNYIDKNYLDIFEQIKKAKMVVWYDFEGFSLPFAPLNLIKPYHQVVFQVSVIVTKNDEEVQKQNLVLDPQNMTSDDFIKIINSIFISTADAYVVYNKNYEITRLKEMSRILYQENHPDKESFSKKLEDIEIKTIDLCELFEIHSKNKIPKIILFDQKLKYSIKNVENHITKHQIKLKRMITPYKKLNVSNGAMAMEIAIDRALNIIGDSKWEEKKLDLIKYCENDVRAMIMVFDFIKYLLEQHAD